MELITIYEKEEEKVETYEEVINFLEFIVNTEFRLNKEQANLFLYNTLDLIKNSFNLKDKKIITTSKVPILNRGGVFELTGAYQVLEDAIFLLSEMFDLTEGILSDDWKNNLSNYIKSYYILTYNKNCDILFYSKDFYGISCSVILIDGDNLYILPIKLNETDFYQRFS